MGMRTKKFDCVQMKNNIQRELRQEYESGKAQFTSYADFINSTADESEGIRAFRDKVAKAKTKMSD